MTYHPFIAYYTHLAKLQQVANKKTMFLAYLLSNMNFSKTVRLHIVDLTQHLKLEIMSEICPELKDTKAKLNRAGQYLQELKKAGIIKPMEGLRGTWMVDPECFGGKRFVTKNLREKNATVYATYKFMRDSESSEIKAYDENGNEIFYQEDPEYPELRAVE